MHGNSCLRRTRFNSFKHNGKYTHHLLKHLAFVLPVYFLAPFDTIHRKTFPYISNRPLRDRNAASCLWSMKLVFKYFGEVRPATLCVYTVRPQNFTAAGPLLYRFNEMISCYFKQRCEILCFLWRIVCVCVCVVCVCVWCVCVWCVCVVCVCFCYTKWKWNQCGWNICICRNLVGMKKMVGSYCTLE